MRMFLENIPSSQFGKRPRRLLEDGVSDTILPRVKLKYILSEIQKQPRYQRKCSNVLNAGQLN